MIIMITITINNYALRWRWLVVLDNKEFTPRRRRRQRERQQSYRFRQTKQQLRTFITLFVHFSAVVARLQRETA